MRILLPPSEGKQPGGDQPSLSQSTGQLRGLAAPRRAVAAAVRELTRQGTAATAAALAIPANLAPAALAANKAAWSSPTMPALERYRGVVYDGLAVDSLPESARSAADHSVLIFSGLLGVSRGSDPVPDYRVPAKAALPQLGIAGTFWRAALQPVLDRELAGEFVIDMRSSDYAPMWRPGSTHRRATVAVRILTERADGSRSVVSHFSKHAKGQLARQLLLCANDITGIPDVTAAWLAIEPTGSSELGALTPAGHVLDLIQRDPGPIALRR